MTLDKSKILMAVGTLLSVGGVIVNDAQKKEQKKKFKEEVKSEIMEELNQEEES